MATMATVQGESSSYVKPKTLKECIIRVLQEAGPGGLTIREIVQRIKKKKWWDWKNDEAGYSSVASVCCAPIYRDVFVRVAPGTYALCELQDDDFTPYDKPKTLKEAIILVLQKAGPGGLHVKEVVQRIKKRKWWDWENDKQGYTSVSATCCMPSNRDVFVHVAPGTYALWELQDDDFTPYEKPMTLKEAIILVLQEAGPGGLTIREIFQRIKEDELWDWENEKQGPTSVSVTCRKHPDVFIKHSHGVYALKSLQGGEGEGSSQALAKEKARVVQSPPSGAKRTREVANESTERANKTKKAVETFLEEIWKECVQGPQSCEVPLGDRRLLLYTDKQTEGMGTFERDLEQASGEPKAMGEASSSARESKEKSFSDLTFITLTDFTTAELKAIADSENKRIGIQVPSKKEKENEKQKPVEKEEAVELLFEHALERVPNSEPWMC